MDSWECSNAENDLKVGGKLKATMSAKDKSFSFEFGGTYTKVIDKELLEFVMGDNRKVIVEFKKVETGVKVIETFDAENLNSVEMQKQGWQSILNNFKKYVESK